MKLYIACIGQAMIFMGLGFIALWFQLGWMVPVIIVAVYSYGRLMAKWIGEGVPRC